MGQEDLSEVVDQQLSPSLGRVELPPPFNSLEAHIHQVIVLVEKLARDHHDDRNEINAFMNYL